MTVLICNDTGVRIRKERGRDYHPACQLWLSVGRPALDSRVGSGVDPVVFPLAWLNLCKDGQPGQTVGVPTPSFDHS